MRPSKKGKFILLPILLCMSLVFCSCGAENKQSGGNSATKQSESSQGTKGSRDNTPVVLTGQAGRWNCNLWQRRCDHRCIPYIRGIYHGFLYRHK